MLISSAGGHYGELQKIEEFNNDNNISNNNNNKERISQEKIIKREYLNTITP